MPNDFLPFIDLRRLYPEQRHKKPVMLPCPFHNDTGKPNYGLYEKNAYCFRCGESEGALQFIMRVKECSMQEALNTWVPQLLSDDAMPATEATPTVPTLMDSSIVSVFEENLQQHPDRADWLTRKYGLDPLTIQQARIGFAEHEYAIPVFGLDDLLYNVRYRIVPEREKPGANRYFGTRGRNAFRWYLTPTLRGESLQNSIEHYYGKRNVAITEGEFDALALYQLGVPTISGTNGANALTNKDKEHFDALAGLRVYLFYDQDEPGQAAASKLCANMRSVGIDAHNVTWQRSAGKDASELVAGGADIYYIRRIIREAITPLTSVQ